MPGVRAEIMRALRAASRKEPGRPKWGDHVKNDGSAQQISVTEAGEALKPRWKKFARKWGVPIAAGAGIGAYVLANQKKRKK